MRAYPVIIYTDPKTSEVHAIQVDDYDLTIDTEQIHMWASDMYADTRITISAQQTREITADSHDQAFATLARTLGQEIDRLEAHAHNEYKRGLDDGQQRALTMLHDLINPTEEEVSFDD